MFKKKSPTSEIRTMTKPQDNNLELKVAITQLNFREPFKFTSHPYIEQVEKWNPSGLMKYLHHYYGDQKVSYKFNKEFTEVNNSEDFEDMLSHLKARYVWAVDLEHHDAHSYSGITCLIQISTRDENFLIDVFNLNKEIKKDLKPLMESKDHVKILHASFNDMRWMQRDFDIFAWPVIDTQVIYRFVKKKNSGLNIALTDLMEEYFPIVKFNKTEEDSRADFRIRPIPRDMKKYAVQDTIYLIPILDQLLKDVRRDKALSRTFLTTCAIDIANKALYSGKLYPSAEEDAVRGMPIYEDTDIETFIALHNWRDDMAKLLDENPIRILPTISIICLSRLHKCHDIKLVNIVDRIPPQNDDSFLKKVHINQIMRIVMSKIYKKLDGGCIQCEYCEGQIMVLEANHDWTRLVREHELWTDWRPQFQSEKSSDCDSLGCEKPEDLPTHVIEAMSKHVAAINKFPFSKSSKIGQFTFTGKDISFFIHHLKIFGKNIQRILECDCCQTPFKEPMIFDLYCNCGWNSCYILCRSCCRINSRTCPRCRKLLTNTKFTKVEVLTKLIQELEVFKISVNIENCPDRIQAIANVLRNCELELMCQYCFRHLKNAVLVKRKSDGFADCSVCCSECEQAYTKYYGKYQKSIRLFRLDDIASQLHIILDRFLRYCEQHKTPVERELELIPESGVEVQAVTNPSPSWVAEDLIIIPIAVILIGLVARYCLA